MDEYHHNANQTNQPRAALPGLIENPGIPLELDRKGWPGKTIDNFFTALEWDYEFSKVRYNELPHVISCVVGCDRYFHTSLLMCLNFFAPEA